MVKGSCREFVPFPMAIIFSAKPMHDGRNLPFITNAQILALYSFHVIGRHMLFDRSVVPSSEDVRLAIAFFRRANSK